MNKPALKKLAELLEKEEKNPDLKYHFDMRYFARADMGYENKELERDTKCVEMLASCDRYAACAIGVAMLSDDPVFAGLSPVWEKGKRHEGSNLPPSLFFSMTPCLTNETDIEFWVAIKAFFDLSMAKAMFLFDPQTWTTMSHKITRPMVITRIHHLLAGGELPEDMDVKNWDFEMSETDEDDEAELGESMAWDDTYHENQ